jgi:predicted nucleic acid-binding protein
VSAEAPFGGGIFIADSSAWWRADRLPGDVSAEWQRAVINGQIAATAPITLEILYSAKSVEDFRWWQERLWALHRVGDINRATYWTALEVYRELAAQDMHRHMPLPDLLAGAAASAHHWGVIHFDRHFDRLAELESLTFESRWIVPSDEDPLSPPSEPEQLS